ncbi:hypothetical protein GCM10020331_040270 [Ectobacillus funiculus]
MRKINLFERVIGELDDILTRIDMKKILRTICMKFSPALKVKARYGLKMDNLTSIIELAQQSGTGADHYAAT